MLGPVRPASLALVVGLVLAGCSSSGTTSNGEAGKPVTQILADVRAAVAAERSVHVLVANGPVGIDLELVGGQGGSGSISADGLRVAIVRVGGHVFVKAGPAFWRRLGRSGPAAERLSGRWIESPPTGAPFDALAPFTQVQILLGELTRAPQMQALLGGLPQASGAIVKDAMINRDGKRVLSLADRRLGLTLDVAASGAPLPVEMTIRSLGTIRYEEWNRVAAPKAPPGAVAYASITG
jgi:hypothetical protein